MYTVSQLCIFVINVPYCLLHVSELCSHQVPIVVFLKMRCTYIANIITRIKWNPRFYICVWEGSKQTEYEILCVKSVNESHFRKILQTCFIRCCFISNICDISSSEFSRIFLIYVWFVAMCSIDRHNVIILVTTKY